MGEKELCSDAVPLQPPQRPARRSKIVEFIINVTIAVLLVKGTLWAFTRAVDFCNGQPANDTNFNVTLISWRYSDESITWEPCGEVDGRDKECSSIQVPMNHFAQDGHSDSDKTFTIALARLRGRNATKNMLINPGGPGGSGLDFLVRGGKELRSIIGEDHHILAFDPRGVGKSTPSAICFPNQQTRSRLFKSDGIDPEHDAPAVFAYHENLSRACVDTMGEHGKYINTPQTAADMNSILDAVGQDGMVYWGFSYGTILGQTYAGLFPERAERVIIDGVANQFDWFDGLYDDSSLQDSDNVVKGFFAECINAGDRCPLSSFADTAEDLQKNVTAMIDSMQQDPMSVYLDSKTYGTLDYRTLWYDALFFALYKPTNWLQLAENLADLMGGNGTKALLQYTLGNGTVADDLWESNMVITLNDYRTGEANWPQDRQALLDMVLPKLTSSAFSRAQYVDYLSRALWRIPTTHSYKPRRGVETRHPLLILSTTYDPVCPLAAAKAAQEGFAGSKLVEVRGYGHCSLARPSTCIAKHVRAFLGDGTLPDDKHTTCDSEEPYFVPPGDKTATASGVELSEDEELLAALRDMSSAMDFRFRPW